MQVLCGLQGIFLLFNCQTPEISLREMIYIRENHKDLFSTSYTIVHLLLLTFKCKRQIFLRIS